MMHGSLESQPVGISGALLESDIETILEISSVRPCHTLIGRDISLAAIYWSADVEGLRSGHVTGSGQLRAAGSFSSLQANGLHSRLGFQTRQLSRMVTVQSTVDTGHEDMIHDAQMDFYGTRLATCSSDRSVRIFDVKDGTQSLNQTLVGHEGPVWQVAWAHPRCVLEMDLNMIYRF
jgi:WD40 repeat protein